jgi:cytochrome c553
MYASDVATDLTAMQCGEDDVKIGDVKIGDVKVRGNAAWLSLAISLGIAFAATPALAQQGNADRAKNKVSMCIGCHGILEYRTAYPEVYRVPMIAGQNTGYIVSALKAYRSGERNHPSMRGIAATLSDDDMADLAAYYNSAKAK